MTSFKITAHHNNPNLDKDTNIRMALLCRVNSTFQYIFFGWDNKTYTCNKNSVELPINLTTRISHEFSRCLENSFSS